MTEEQFKNIKWTFSTHLAMEGCHSTVYVADTPFSLLRCAKVPVNDFGEPKGRATVHYMLDGKVIKTKKKILEAIKEL